ncbi:MAG: RlmE family RNA methyltransferase [Hyphomicrobiales bacterium]
MKHAAAKANRWEDHYTRLARKERFPARSVYKLQEIQKRFAVIRVGDNVLDLGCAPGSWLMYAAGLTGPSGRVVGIDVSPVTVQLPAHVAVHTQDVFELTEEPTTFFGQTFDVVVSDMAPATTGSRGVDAARSHNLCEAALTIARKVLRPGGAFVCKIFQGEGFKQFSEAVRSDFSECKIFKPQSCRKASKEIYLIGKGKLGGPHVRS